MPAASASASASAPAEPPPPPLSEEQLKAAAAKGLDALLALKAQAPQSPALLRAIAAEQVKQKKTEDALAAFRELFAADPQASLDPAMQGALIDLLLGEKKPEPIFDFLEKEAGAGGLDVFFTLGFSPKASAFVKKKAAELLAKGKDGASPALKVAMGLRSAAGVGPKGICSQAARLRQLFDDAKEHGDQRAMMFLVQLTGSKKDCGSWLSRTNCYACIQGDGRLNAAISAIREREKQKKD